MPLSVIRDQWSRELQVTIFEEAMHSEKTCNIMNIPDEISYSDLSALHPYDFNIVKKAP
jgi:hypothetical protein